MSKIGTSEQAKRVPVAAKTAAARNLVCAERLAESYTQVFQIVCEHGMPIPRLQALISNAVVASPESSDLASETVNDVESFTDDAGGGRSGDDSSRAQHWLKREQNLRARWLRVGGWSLSGVAWNGRRQALRLELATCRASALAKAKIDRRTVDAFMDEVVELASRVVPGGDITSEDVAERFGVTLATFSDFAEQLSAVRDSIRRERATMVHQNRALVAGIARRFAGKGIQVDDLVQEGNLGLLRAIDKFDPKRGFQFSTYAIWWIRQAISRAVLDQGRSVRVPVHLKEQTTRVRNIEGRLAHRLGRAPTREEIAVDAGISEAKLQHLQQQLRADVSLQRPLHNDSEGELGDLLEDDRALQAFGAVELSRLEQHLSDALSKLDPRSQFVVRAHMGLGGQPSLTLDGISQQLGISRERVRQIEREALLRLRRCAEESHLSDYV